MTLPVRIAVDSRDYPDPKLLWLCDVLSSILRLADQGASPARPALPIPVG